MDIRPVRAMLVRVDRQTYRHDEANNHFLKFCKHV